MPAYVEELDDHNGDIVDRLFYCSWCASKQTPKILPWPGFDWPDYDVHCDNCEELVHKGENLDG